MLRIALLLCCFALSANAAEPSKIWGAEPTPPNEVWSERFYPVGQNAMRPRAPVPGETSAETEFLNTAWEAGIRTYLRRVSHMVAGMNLPDDEVRMAECEKMGALLHPRFQHREGRRGGFVLRDKAHVLKACADRAFLMDGFYALTVRAIATGPNLVQVTTCYYHNQWNDPLVKGGGHFLPNGMGEAVPRASIETVIREPGQPWQILLHVALDSDEALIRGGCAAAGS